MTYLLRFIYSCLSWDNKNYHLILYDGAELFSLILFLYQEGLLILELIFVVSREILQQTPVVIYYIPLQLFTLNFNIFFQARASLISRFEAQVGSISLPLILPHNYRSTYYYIAAATTGYCHYRIYKIHLPSYFPPTRQVFALSSFIAPNSICKFTSSSHFAHDCDYSKHITCYLIFHLLL